MESGQPVGGPPSGPTRSDDDGPRDEPKVSREVAERALSVIGKYKSGSADLAENHDEEYALAIEERWKSR